MRERIWIVVRDGDAKVFNVLGPSMDDTEISDGVCEAQQQGRKVSCSTVALRNQPDRKSLIEGYTQDFGFTYTDDPII